ncbi:hypothetical protein CEXT_731991 [Caerostris extrusa]|uniref:Uncharacterized protein n=1 Tax=Caerostris extrusa TaxID=172846 RepID=A0AAV4V5I5_CAEEX|nr:hypothetical protein CEXT_731991 [Caerostris extrusa]
MGIFVSIFDLPIPVVDKKTFKPCPFIQKPPLTAQDSRAANARISYLRSYEWNHVQHPRSDSIQGKRRFLRKTRNFVPPVWSSNYNRWDSIRSVPLDHLKTGANHIFQHQTSSPRRRITFIFHMRDGFINGQKSSRHTEEEYFPFLCFYLQNAEKNSAP